MTTQITIESDGLAEYAQMPPDVTEQLHRLWLATLQRLHLNGWYVISLVVTDDATIHHMNQQYRQIDKPTDVLSFPQCDAPLLALPADQAWADRRSGDDTHATYDLPPASDRDTTAHSVATFTYGTSAMPLHLGDIMIAVPTVAAQAQQAEHSFWWEFAYLAVHGLLHLVGYDDYYQSGYQAMVDHQEALLLWCDIRKISPVDEKDTRYGIETCPQ